MNTRNTATRDKHRAAIAKGHPPCAICGQPIDYTLKHPHPRSFVVDHIIPLSKGGTDALANKQAAHRQPVTATASSQTASTAAQSYGAPVP